MKNLKPVAACYMRYSSHAQDEGFSIEAQKLAIDRYAKANNFDLKYYYSDLAKSATNATKRPDFKKMISDAEQGKFAICLVHKLDRFSRNVADTIIYTERLQLANVQLISVTENFSNDPEGEMALGLTSLIAQYYSKNLAREVKKGHHVKALKGLHNGGIPPLGFSVNEASGYELVESEAESVRLIFDKFTQGYSYKDIIEELNAKGYKTKLGKTFAVSSLSSILTQRKYIGEYVYNQRISKARNGSCNSRIKKPESDIIRIPNALPRIIDDITFEKAQNILSARKSNKTTSKNNSTYYLTGLIKCGKCDYHYQGNSRKSGSRKSIYSSYRCGKKQNKKCGCGNKEIEKNRLETFVLEQLQKLLISDDAIKELVKIVNEHNIKTAKLNNTDLPRYEKELKEIKKQIKRTTTAIAKGVNQDLMIETIKSLDSTKKDLEKRIANITLTALPKISESDIKKALLKFNEYIKENKCIEFKLFLRQHIECIVVHEDKVEVTFIVASAIFNASYPDDTTGMIKIMLEITRSELKSLPKQRRKSSQNGHFGKSYLKGYEIILN